MNQQNCYADSVIKHAKIYTVSLSIDEIKNGNTEFPVIENGAVAIKDGKIISICDAVQIESYIGNETTVIDAKGKTLVPGFIDSHIHAMWTGLDLAKIDFSPCQNRNDFFNLIKEKVKTTPKGQWIEGLKWNHLSWSDTTIPTREELDQICPDHPVFFMRVCYHMALANSKALELAGINQSTVQPDGGEIVKDESGEPTGLLYENGAMSLVQSVIPMPSKKQLLEAVETMGTVLNQAGITSVIEANLSSEQMRIYQRAYEENKLSYRSALLYFLDYANGNLQDHLKRLELAVATNGFGDDMLQLSAVKVLLDGIPANGTAYMRNNYKHMPHTNGLLNMPKEDVEAISKKANEMDWQICFHTVGNKAADVALESFQLADQTHPVYEQRHYLVHHPWPCPDQFEQMRKMNIGVALQPTIYHIHGESAILPTDMAHFNTPCKTYFDEGIIAGGSSDNPIGHYNPFLNFYICVTRKDKNGQVWGEDQKITPRQALIMWTKNSAYLMGAENKLGAIEEGYYADLVLTNQDFLTCEPDDILKTEVELTMLGGKIVYKKD